MFERNVVFEQKACFSGFDLLLSGVYLGKFLSAGGAVAGDQRVGFGVRAKAVRDGGAACGGRGAQRAFHP